MHALSRTFLSRLQKVQNAGLRFVYNVRWDYFTTAEAQHEAASLPALNVRFHAVAVRTCERMEAEKWNSTTTSDKNAVTPQRGNTRGFQEA